MDQVIEGAIRDAAALAAAGFDALLVENYNDVPFFPDQVPPECAVAMALCCREVARAVCLPLGVNVLRNDARTALGIAVAAGLGFIRVNVHSGVMVTDQGLIAGRAHDTLRLRRSLGADVAILADVWVKHATPLGGGRLEQAAEDLAHRGLADALIVTGPGTGKPVELERLHAVKSACAPLPVFVGSGVTPESAADLLAVADGAIVGSACSRDGVAGSGIDPERARRFIQAAAVRRP